MKLRALIQVFRSDFFFFFFLVLKTQIYNNLAKILLKLHLVGVLATHSVTIL